jgi:hypothetical protein
VLWHLFSQSNHPDPESNNNDDDNDSPAPRAFDLDTFLDTPFFDPNRVANDEKSPPLLRKFAQFVQNDYPTAEAIFTGIFFVMLMVVGQELVRMQIYGDNYVPFTKGVLPGNLF